MDDISLSFYSEYVDENALNPPSTRVSFTPTRVKPQPRAWERKPSTPFAPRSDAQKIWKRVPLQNVTSSINASWRKASIHGDGIMRPVKRQRIGGQEDVGNKGHAGYIGVKWDTNESSDTNPRRRVPTNHHASGQAFNSLSPQKNNFFLAEPDPGVPSDQMKSPQAAVEAAEGVAASEEEVAPRLDPELLRQSQPEDSHRIDSCAAAEQLLGDADVFLRMSPESSPAHPSLIDGTLISSPFDLGPFDPNTKMSPVPPISRLPLKDMGQSIVSEPESKPQPHTEEQQVAAPSYNDQDDTSYLQDFLLRSRAQKAAKSRLTAAPKNQERQPVSQIDIEIDKEYSKPLAKSTVETEYATSVSGSLADEAWSELFSSPKPSSPQRRSNRLTRLPRPQKTSTTLPNSIALRRLNGSEFISLQREAQSLAATTRGNTRKNKGMAVGVQARLVELKSEPPDSAGADREGEEGVEASIDTAMGVGVRENGKRKSVVWAEVLALFQEYTGPESSGYSSPSSDSSSQTAPHPEQAPPEPPETQDEATSSSLQETATIKTKRNISIADPKENTTTNAVSQKRKAKQVRKLRKESVGSVNGTPAPKRSIEILLQDAVGGTRERDSGMGEARTGEKEPEKKQEEGMGKKEVEKGVEKGTVGSRMGNETLLGKRTRSKAKH